MCGLKDVSGVGDVGKGKRTSAIAVPGSCVSEYEILTCYNHGYVLPFWDIRSVSTSGSTSSQIRSMIWNLVSVQVPLGPLTLNPIPYTLDPKS